MSRLTIAALGLALMACSTAPAAPPAQRAEAPAPPAPPSGGGAVVVELFTSQGCSSCPPADALLARLARGELTDQPVIALGFHVDYWDDLGWADPFASAAGTARQRRYADGADGRVYTPQLVIGGRRHVVGSQERAVRAALAEAALVPALDAAITLDGATLHVRATTPPGARAVAAIYEDGLITEVRAGENHGETLRNDRVVRALVPVDGTAALALDPSWARDRLGVVVIAQDDHGIVAARQVAWPLADR